MIRRILLLFALILLALGCEPNVNQDWAKESVKRNEATIKALEAELASAYKELDPGQLYFTDGGDRATLQAEYDQRVAAFEQRVLKLFEAQPLVIGYSLSYTVPKIDKDPIQYGLGALTNKIPSLRAGRVIRSDRGKLEIEGKKIGWGFYQIPGKETQKVVGVIDRRMFYPGVEVVGKLEHHDTILHYTLFLLDTAPQG
jgi:hypothetical protein